MHRLLLLGLLLFVGPPAGSSPSARARRPDSLCANAGFFAEELLHYSAGLVTRSDSAAVAARAQYDLLPASAGDVAFVTDERVCESAARAHAELFETGDTAGPTPVVVVRAGDQRYVVFGGARRAGEVLVYDIFDRDFQYLLSIAR
ncbi:MAG TPA: hypothetical protein VKA84_09675 [Gemmatimonadaceae bacterium]|nr:hypothetical protein [Gemmatimonadaceae bacterium]